jgi:hypothetical protein
VVKELEVVHDEITSERKYFDMVNSEHQCHQTSTRPLPIPEVGIRASRMTRCWLCHLEQVGQCALFDHILCNR